MEMADKQYTVLLCQNAKNAEELIAKGGITATVEFAFGDKVYGDPAYDHHGSRSANHSPCNDPQIQPVERGTFAVNHIDADCLGGLLALMGRKPEDPEFWTGVEYIDNAGPQHIEGMPEEFRDKMNAFYAWNYRDGQAHSEEVLTARTGTVDITAKVERAADAFETILGERAIYRTAEEYLASLDGRTGDREVMFEDGTVTKIYGGPDQYYDSDGRSAAESLHVAMVSHGGILNETERMIAEGRKWREDITKATESKLIYESENIRVFSTDRVSCSSAYYSPGQDRIFPATLVYNEHFNSITLAFYDGGREQGGKFSAKDIMQAEYGDLAGGRDGIAGSPRGKSVSRHDLIDIVSNLELHYRGEKEIEENWPESKRIRQWHAPNTEWQLFKVNHTIESKEVVPELKGSDLSPEGYSRAQCRDGVPSVSVFRETYRVNGEKYDTVGLQYLEKAETHSREGFAYTKDLERRSNMEKLTPVTDRGFVLDMGNSHARQDGIQQDAAYVMLKGDKALEDWSEREFHDSYWYGQSVEQAADYLKENAAQEPYTYAEQHPEDARVAIASGNDWYWDYNDDEAFQHMDLRDVTGNLYPSADEKNMDIRPLGAGEQAVGLDSLDPEPKVTGEDHTVSRITYYFPLKGDISVFKEDQFVDGERISSVEGFTETNRLIDSEPRSLFDPAQPDERFLALKDAHAIEEWSHTDSLDAEATRQFLEKNVEEKPYSRYFEAMLTGTERDVIVVMREDVREPLALTKLDGSEIDVGDYLDNEASLNPDWSDEEGPGSQADTGSQDYDWSDEGDSSNGGYDSEEEEYDR